VQIIASSNLSYKLFSVYLCLTTCHRILSTCILRMYFHYTPTRLYHWMASFSVKITQIIKILHFRSIPNMLLFTIGSSGVYIHSVVLKHWRISHSWAVVVSVLLRSVLRIRCGYGLVVPSDFFTFYMIYAYIQVRIGAKGYITCVVYFYAYTCAIILMASGNLKLLSFRDIWCCL